MKACIIQTAYSFDPEDAEANFCKELALMDACTQDMDIIVLPESCDEPAYSKTKEDFHASVRRYREPILKKAAETARRCKALVFINVSTEKEGEYFNTTLAFDRKGEQVGCYYKQHLTPKEAFSHKMGRKYSFEYNEPTILEIEGLRFAFLTCYDFYFYEAFAAIARLNPDILIGCCQQKSDTHPASETMAKFLAYNTNTYVLRASVSLGEDSPVGGKSMIIAPDGALLADLGNQVGLATAEFDPHRHYLKPAGYGGKLKPHHEYIEQGRRPWKYRPAGSAIGLTDDLLPYPRICAHRGFNTIAPENSMPAFGAAVALGADEIEFDLWETLDGEIVSIHDPTLERVSDGTGFVYDHTYEELKTLDFGVRHNERFTGLRILRFEEILKKFSSHVIMNVHIKTSNDSISYEEAHLSRKGVEKIISLIRQYDCERYVYFMTASASLLAALLELAPELPRVAGFIGDPEQQLQNAIRYQCRKIQLFKPYFDQEFIDRAHATGILCNVFYTDDPDEAERFTDMGIDTILTNDYQPIAARIESRLHRYGGYQE